MMIKYFYDKIFIELKHVHMDTSDEKACKTKLLKYKKWLILMIILMKIKQDII